ncbi:putative nucleotidyltransferase, Ribonuclease H [Helianthus annuus]|nr:putative nucleotidyltransferase, Ribonuclease H [Helianthus annuus]
MIRKVNNQGIKRSNQHMAAWMQQPIAFPPITSGEIKDGPIIVSAVIAGHKVRRIYVDSGSATEITYQQCFQQLAPQTKAKLIQVSMPLVSFSSEVVQPIGQITLPTTLGTGRLVRTVNLTYLVVGARSIHNVILGRPRMCAFGIISSTIHGSLKFPTEAGVATLDSESTMHVAEVRQSEGNVQPPSLLTEEWAIHPHFPEQKVAIGAHLPERTKKRLWKLLSSSLDVFAWQTSDMVGVPRCLAEHKLKVSHSAKPVTQRKRNMALARNKAISEDVRKLLNAGIIREVRYQIWVSNPVMVTKKDKTWRMCVDFSDLNNACPKDCYPLPEIDLKIDSLSSFRLKCFLDAYKGYHQIQMALEDEDKTAFVTNEGLFCYTKMSFELKNAGATYQRLMDKAFKGHIGRNLEIYVDDLVIKSQAEDNMIDDILETFTRLRSINLKLNPKKCSFGLEEGKFLGVWITQSGIQAHPEKIRR